jgi:hypothetical protein
MSIAYPEPLATAVRKYWIVKDLRNIVKLNIGKNSKKQGYGLVCILTVVLHTCGQIFVSRGYCKMKRAAKCFGTESNIIKSTAGLGALRR